MGDVEVEARLVHHQIDVALGSGPHRIDAEMNDALLGEPFGRSDVHAGIVGGIFLARKGAFVMAGAEQDRAALRHSHAGLLYRRFEIISRDLGAGRDMAQVDADAGHDAFFQRVLVDRDAARAEMPGRVDMGAAMIRHRDEHRRQPIDVSRIGKRLLVVLPHAVDDRRMTGIARGAMIEFAAEVDDFHRVGL